MHAPQDDSARNPGNDSVLRVLEDVRRELGVTAWTIGAIGAAVALSGTALVGSGLGLVGGIGPIGPEGALSLWQLLITTAPLTLALAFIFGYFASGAGDRYGPWAAGLVVIASLVGFALLLGAVDYNAPPPISDLGGAPVSSSACAPVDRAPDEGVSLIRALCEAMKQGALPAKFFAFTFSVLTDYVRMFGIAVFVSSGALAYQLMRLVTIYVPRLQELERA